MIDTLTQQLNLITKHLIRENHNKEGIEIYFSTIPSGLERDTLKNNNWKWSSFNKCWYIKKADLVIKEESKKEIKKTNKKYNEKQVIAAVNKILKYSEKIRPVLSAFTPLEDNKVAFTDSYRLCVLNKETLPFKVAFTEDYQNKEEYIKKYGNEVVSGTYPNIKKFMELEKTEETFTFKYEDIKEKASLRGWKHKNERLMTFETNKGNKIMLDAEYLKDMINLLQIKEENITMNYYGEVKPCTYENENGFYLALPIKTY